MAGFEHHSERASEIALEIERKLVALDVDWHDASALRQLAKEALAHDPKEGFHGLATTSPDQLARIGLYGLIAVMFETMAESAVNGEISHGSDVWKALAKAMWEEKALLLETPLVSRGT